MFIILRKMMSTPGLQGEATAVNAEMIARALGGRKTGGGWTARCPAHDDCTPSLSIRDADGGGMVMRCHAGCDQDRVS